MHFKAQSAIEYLSTYSWALLIIGIVLAVMVAIGLFSPTSRVSQGCIFQAGFGCVSYTLSSAGSQLTINIQQTQQTPINITAIGCSASTNFSNMQTISPQVNMPIGSNNTFTGITCYGLGSKPASLSPGTLYTGVLLVNYTDTLSGLHHTMFGQLSLKVTS